ncbi:hypothetical protein [Candidatus Vondammii sp. HM_W22]|uniref:hypothetical protein n=1 Tax=Candidatus Vondammii sp. HM_W22 TaxID=2687299 RepID=UPI001F13F558|nr:hypothetical protein [Candidatus Vondammii sp. HM_W22]
MGNRGSEISAGKILTIDTQASELTRLQLNLTAPLRVDSDNGLLIDVIITLNDQPAEGTTPLLVPQIDGIILDGYSAGIPLKPDTRSTAQAPRWTGQLLLPNTVGQDAQGQPTVASLSFTYQAEDDLGNRTTRIRDNHLFQVYQGDLVPLLPPQGLTASALAGGQVALNWEPVEEAAGYTVYRRAASEAGFEQQQTVTETHYRQTAASDSDYFYAVASIRQENNQSATSGLSKAVSVRADRIPPLDRQTSPWSSTVPASYRAGPNRPGRQKAQRKRIH